MMYETVDTFQVACAMGINDAKIFLEKALLTRYPEYKQNFTKFLRYPSYKLKCTFRDRLPTGIQAINIYRHAKLSSTVYIVMTVNPEALCSGHKTNRLFRCTPDNVYALQICYADAVYELCPEAFMPNYGDNDDSCQQETIHLDSSHNDSYTYPIGLASLPYLGLLIPKEADYSLNLYAKNKKLALECLRNSYLDVRKKGSIKQKNVTVPDDDELDFISDTDSQPKNKNLNLYAKNTVSSDCIYDKQMKYDVSGCTDQSLYNEADNIIRLETARKKCTKAWIVKMANLRLRHNERPMGILPYLEPIVANTVLNTFLDKIGHQDWYSDDEATKILEVAVRKGLIKQSLKKSGDERKNSPRLTIVQDILPIISQSRSITMALKNYQTGNYTIAKTQKVVHGTADTFRDYLKLIRSVGMQPYLIPDRRKEKHLENPVKNIVLLGLDHTKLPNRILNMPEVMAMINRINAAHIRQHKNYKANFN